MKESPNLNIYAHNDNGNGVRMIYIADDRDHSYEWFIQLIHPFTPYWTCVYKWKNLKQTFFQEPYKQRRVKHKESEIYVPRKKMGNF